MRKTWQNWKYEQPEHDWFQPVDTFWLVTGSPGFRQTPLPQPPQEPTGAAVVEDSGNGLGAHVEKRGYKNMMTDSLKWDSVQPLKNMLLKRS